MADTLTLPTDIKPDQVKTGMTLRVHQRIKEVDPNGKEKERIQIYEGMVIKLRGMTVSKTMTIRKISGSIGVEKIFPLTLPSIIRLELVRLAKVARKNISFLRHSKKRLKEVRTVTL